VIDHYLRRKASYYALRRACLPVKVIVRPRGNDLVTRVVNDTRQAYVATVRRGWFRVDGTDREVTDAQVDLPANAMVEIGSDPLSPNKQTADWVYGAVLEGETVASRSPVGRHRVAPDRTRCGPTSGASPSADGVPPNQCVWTPVVFRELTVSPPDLHAERRGSELEITSPVFCHAVHVDDGGHERLSDNYFDLLPGIPYRVKVTGDNGEIELRSVTG
ncbi:MAG: hypothetical protein HQ559_18690, partial [Lentisphaerae bacterium]|nr:hypothetical protein [Lentisphaerota bacterium]